jgi:hypothetical protein
MSRAFDEFAAVAWCNNAAAQPDKRYGLFDCKQVAVDAVDPGPALPGTSPRLALRVDVLLDVTRIDD